MIAESESVIPADTSQSWKRVILFRVSMLALVGMSVTYMDSAAIVIVGSMAMLMPMARGSVWTRGNPWSMSCGPPSVKL